MDDFFTKVKGWYDDFKNYSIEQLAEGLKIDKETAQTIFEFGFPALVGAMFGALYNFSIDPSSRNLMLYIAFGALAGIGVSSLIGLAQKYIDFSGSPSGLAAIKNRPKKPFDLAESKKEIRDEILKYVNDNAKDIYSFMPRVGACDKDLSNSYCIRTKEELLASKMLYNSLADTIKFIDAFYQADDKDKPDLFEKIKDNYALLKYFHTKFKEAREKLAKAKTEEEKNKIIQQIFNSEIYEAAAILEKSTNPDPAVQGKSIEELSKDMMSLAEKDYKEVLDHFKKIPAGKEFLNVGPFVGAFSLFRVSDNVKSMKRLGISIPFPTSISSGKGSAFFSNPTGTNFWDDEEDMIKSYESDFNRYSNAHSGITPIDLSYRLTPGRYSNISGLNFNNIPSTPSVGRFV
jgi:hypothetical protein